MAEVMSFDVRVLRLDMRRKLQISLIYKFSVYLLVFIPACHFSLFLCVASLRLEPHSDSVLRNTSHSLRSVCVRGSGVRRQLDAGICLSKMAPRLRYQRVVMVEDVFG